MNEEQKNQEKKHRMIIITKALVKDEEGRILMVRRHRPWHKEAHDKWELPGGKVEFGEHPTKTAERETKEETGYEVKAKKLLRTIHSGIWEHEDRKTNVIVLCYECELIGGTASDEDHGVSEVKWFAKEEIPPKEELLGGTIGFINEMIKEQ